jgi:hypothetical protein
VPGAIVPKRKTEDLRHKSFACLSLPAVLGDTDEGPAIAASMAYQSAISARPAQQGRILSFTFLIIKPEMMI